MKMDSDNDVVVTVADIRLVLKALLRVNEISSANNIHNKFDTHELWQELNGRVQTAFGVDPEVDITLGIFSSKINAAITYRLLAFADESKVIALDEIMDILNQGCNLLLLHEDPFLYAYSEFQTFVRKLLKEVSIGTLNAETFAPAFTFKIPKKED